MKYIVLRNFYDRFDNMKLCQTGDEHKPPNEERAIQLVKQGFIEPVPGYIEGAISMGPIYAELEGTEKIIPLDEITVQVDGEKMAENVEPVVKSESKPKGKSKKADDDQ